MKSARLIWMLFLTASPCAAGVETQSKALATLEVRYEGDKRKLSLADLITVELGVEGSQALRVEAPTEPPAGWLLVERSAERRHTIASHRVRWQLTHRFAPREPGKKVPFAFPAVKIRDERETTVAWDAIDFEVTTQIAKADLSQLQGIPSIEPAAPLPVRDSTWLWWLALSAGVFITIALAVLIRLGMRKSAPRTPAQLALREWRRLMGMNLPATGRSERFITLLTLLVRRYLERQFDLPARRQTTPEFLSRAAQSDRLTVEEQQFLSTFLKRCDAIKFAGVDMPPDECSRLAEAARQFLEQRNSP